MAKRKKKSGGGAFGKSGNGGLGAVPPLRALNPRGSEETMKLVQRIAAGRGFETMEEIQRFMNEEVIGRTPEELAAMADEVSPATPVEQADRMIEDLPENASAGNIVRTAKQALALSEESMAAWLAWGIHAESDDKAMEVFEKGITRGRNRFADLIAETGPNHGLWGHIEARDFMRLLHERAKLLEMRQDAEGAIAAYREMLAFNPHDNQGIRGDLLHLFMVFRRIEEGRTLLNAYPNDADTAMAWGHAFVSIVEAVDRSDYKMPDDASFQAPESPEAYIKTLGPEFDSARAAVKHAAKVNPFVPLLYTEGGLLDVETDDLVTFGGPYEAVSYLRRWAIIWHATGLPMLFMAAAAPTNPKKLIRTKHIAEELEYVAVQLEEYDGIPWWQELEDRLQ
jgi:tetratricopeptide (TPR) repeat protein